MADFPDLLDSALRARLAGLGVRADDVDERFIRGSGPGGQKINKTSSTVWLRHGPTGVEVRCQRERSLAANRVLAWTELADRLASIRDRAAQAVRDERELARRQTRQKPRGQKRAMVAAKRHRARRRANRNDPGGW